MEEILKKEINIIQEALGVIFTGKTNEEAKAFIKRYNAELDEFNNFLADAYIDLE